MQQINNTTFQTPELGDVKPVVTIGALNSVLKITELGFEVVVPLILDLESSELKDLI